MREISERIVTRHRFLLAVARGMLFLPRRCRQAAYLAIRPLVIRRYLKYHQVRKLQIGAGSNALPGWLNTDKSPATSRVAVLDAAARFPFKDATFDYVYSEHLIEHLTYQQGRAMLRECFRILKPGGKIRIATPDLEAVIGLHAPQKTSVQERYIRWIVDKYLPEIGVYRDSIVINNAFRNWGHQFLYDYATLESALREAGFTGVARWSVGESDDQVLRGIETHGLSCGDEEMNRFETMVVEARRPGDAV